MTLYSTHQEIVDKLPLLPEDVLEQITDRLEYYYDIPLSSVTQIHRSLLLISDDLSVNLYYWIDIYPGGFAIRFEIVSPSYHGIASFNFGPHTENNYYDSITD